MQNCFDCKHRLTKFSDLDRIDDDMVHIHKDLYGKCLVGNSPALAEFWRANGHKRRSDDIDTLPCYEQTEFDARMDRLLALADEALIEVRRK